MRNYLSGMLFSLLSLLSFLFIRTVDGLWGSFAWSLLLTIVVFLFYRRKINWDRKDIIVISFSTGLFYLLFASFGISLYPPEPIRDLGDIIMPYLHAGMFGVYTMIVMFLSGMVFNKLRS
ncbi:hypothetical protein [Bacillus sp. es.034]|uniref:hypothetical protein n=1 Tax=Bacillus sp. es.034 TaxID=1761763 RepID=UPI000BF69F02|nr:hypothetical protein [Bacillus sp. es.034]PFG07531.1 hypothetical protein ATG71_4431 [Bacillus sp. es.034]